MDIQYSNYVSFSTTYMEYRYYLTAVPKSDFKSEQVIAGAGVYLHACEHCVAH